MELSKLSTQYKAYNICKHIYIYIYIYIKAYAEQDIIKKQENQ